MKFEIVEGNKDEEVIWKNTFLFVSLIALLILNIQVWGLSG